MTTQAFYIALYFGSNFLSNNSSKQFILLFIIVIQTKQPTESVGIEGK